jgi:hypothetical protein
MPLVPPPTIEQQANIIGLACKDFVDPRGGKVELMENMRKLWEEVYKISSSQEPRILVCFNGETSRGAFSIANTQHRVDRSWIVVILRGKGFNAATASARGIGDKEGVTESFLSSVETLRDKLRVILNISEEFPIDYKGIKPLPGIAPSNAGGVFIDGYSIEFSTANDLLDVLLQNSD